MFAYVQQMLRIDDHFVCIHCGEPTQELYKKYSASVLKLKTCDSCNKIADKYIEYDPVIIIIDLVLLNREAYRHVLYNTGFSIHWKLLMVLLLMETYSEWVVKFPPDYKTPVVLHSYFTADFSYYKTFLKVASRAASFFVVILILTVIYNLWTKKKNFKELFFDVWKCTILSSFGIFLLLPSLIWNIDVVHDYHHIFVSLYTTLSQLVAYTVTCDCHKLWSIFVILTSYYFKIVHFDFVNA
ncbi:PREDICTED: protein ARV1 [Nicrophorus vespilloides]|uniref:Protein ARV n=1 Tax=Nicrophorus vespilloides TaxID=110193 RepID=A0ABM1MTD0_NICVS|nr:PREDICTED: protein ARV1 [Nicrophorus vespilloides]